MPEKAKCQKFVGRKRAANISFLPVDKRQHMHGHYINSQHSGDSIKSIDGAALPTSIVMSLSYIMDYHPLDVSTFITMADYDHLQWLPKHDQALATLQLPCSSTEAHAKSLKPIEPPIDDRSIELKTNTGFIQLHSTVSNASKHLTSMLV
jgi:hypothetical protein